VYVSRRAREAKRGHHSEANARMDGLVVSIQYTYTTLCRRTRIINVHKKIWRERTGSFHAYAGGVRSIPNFNRRNTNKRWSRRPERRGSMLDRGVVGLIGYIAILR